jgi:cytochrome c oxidase cbb3-type subunit 3
MRLLACVLTVTVAVGLAGCEREARRLTSSVSNSTPGENAPRMSTNQPGVALTGGVKEPAQNVSPYDGNAFAVNNGKRLFRWYNCAGCHAGGGGGIGPALMDSEWRYGSDPKNIFTSIMQGRPDGMPSFGGHIPEDQAWQIVAYVRSMSGGVRKDVAPSRTDSLYPGQPENARPGQPARPEGKMQ